MLLRFSSAAALAAGLAAPCLAAEDQGAVQLAANSGVIVVTGTRDAYGADTSRGATRTDTPLRDVPQAVSVVTERQIEDQAMRSIGDVLRVVPGASIGQGEGHRDQITLRGNNSTADFFIDGLRDDIQYYRPLYNLQRVEVLRGPNAMIFGRGGGGGVINRVQKVPLFTPTLGAAASVNSFGAWSGEIDLNQPLSLILAGRLNAVYEEFGNHRDVYDGRLIAVNPTLRLLPGNDTGISLSYEFVDDERVVDRGVPAAFTGSIATPAGPLQGFRDTFFGSPEGNRTQFQAHILRGTAEHRFTDTLSLISRLQYADYDKSYVNAFPATAVRTVAGAPVVGVEAYLDAFQRENLFSQTDLVWEFNTGGIGHTLLGGIEFGVQDTGNQRLNGFFSGPGTSNGGRRVDVALADPFRVPAFALRPGAANGERSTRTDADLFAVYVQDQIDFGPVELLAGLRYDRIGLEAVDLITGLRAARVDELWSPRLGLVVRPVEPVSLYASYSRSFLPQSGDQFNALDVTAANLEAERFDNLEIGAKWQVRDGLLLSAALYQLDRTNTRAPGSTPGSIVQTGEQRSRGLEIEAAGTLLPGWQLSFGYALQEAEIRTTTAAAPAGRDVPLVPQHQLSLWSRHDLTARLGIGLGVRHQSRSFASISNAVVLPAHTRVDAALFYRISDGLEAQINVENLLDEAYFPTAHNDNNLTPGAPLNARATLRLRL